MAIIRNRVLHMHELDRSTLRAAPAPRSTKQIKQKMPIQTTFSKSNIQYDAPVPQFICFVFGDLCVYWSSSAKFNRHIHHGTNNWPHRQHAYANTMNHSRAACKPTSSTVSWLMLYIWAQECRKSIKIRRLLSKLLLKHTLAHSVSALQTHKPMAVCVCLLSTLGAFGTVYVEYMLF